MHPAWQLYGSLPHTRVEDIEIQYESRLIRIGTHGRGILEAPIVVGVCADGVDDSDADTVCDDYDVCADFDDLLLGTACDDGDSSTQDDVYVDCALCAGQAPLGLSSASTEVFRLSPNPTTGVVDLVLRTDFAGSARVYALSGRLLQEYRLNGRSAKLDLSTLAPALYFIQLTDRQGVVVAWEKVVVE